MKTQPLLWSIRRELWETRSLYVAPAAVAAVVVFAFLVSTFARSHAAQTTELSRPYDFAAVMLMAVMFLVSIFYCLDALHGERRDRSILFWKSLPVSDLTTVMSKLAIPMLVLPVITWIATMATQFVMLLLRGTGAPWGEVAASWPMVLYHLITVHSLYYAPIFAWLLFVSAWARRMPFLWAFLPLAAIAIVERVAFQTSNFGHMLGRRVSGGDMDMKGPMLGHFMPFDFLMKPGLWIGFAIAAVFIAAAVRLRRAHGPI